MRRLEAKDLKELNLLKYYRIVRRWACKTNNLTSADLELLIYFDCIDLFSRQDYIDGIYTYSWDKDRWRRLVREGWIVVWRNRNKTTQKYNIYKVSTKCKLLINKIYKILLGEADLPVGERHNPFMKGLSYTDNVMKKATELINNDKTR